MSHSVHCHRCGSRRIRRAHTPEGWPKFVRRWTPLRRYACGTCGHRGWTLHQFRIQPQEKTPTSSRPLEGRDLRHKYAHRRSMLRLVFLAALLGAMLGYLILRQVG